MSGVFYFNLLGLPDWFGLALFGVLAALFGLAHVAAWFNLRGRR